MRAVIRDGDTLSIEAPQRRPLKLGPLAPELAEAIQMLKWPGAPLAGLREQAGAAGPEEVARLDFYLSRFRQGRLLEWALVEEGVEIVLFQALDGGFGPADGRMPDARQSLSRFAYLRCAGTEIALDSAETPCRAVLREPAITALASLAGNPGETAEGMPATLIDALWRMGFLEPSAGPEAQARASWEFPDRLLHMASRLTRDAVPLGGTYRFQHRFPSPPSRKPPMSDLRLALPVPDMASLARTSRPLALLSEARRTNRDWSDRPIPLEKIAEFLWRVARVQQAVPGTPQDLMMKPIPGAGGIHELEWYLAAGSIEALPAGLHHYDGFEHALYQLPDSEAAARRMRQGAARSAGQADRPPTVLVLLATRLPRLAWKYQGIAYRISLLNAGVAIEAMQLAAADIGLACCAIGTGELRPFEQATGLSSWEETPLAEIALGMPNGQAAVAS